MNMLITVVSYHSSFNNLIKFLKKNIFINGFYLLLFLNLCWKTKKSCDVII